MDKKTNTTNTQSNTNSRHLSEPITDRRAAILEALQSIGHRVAAGDISGQRVPLVILQKGGRYAA